MTPSLYEVLRALLLTLAVVSGFSGVSIALAAERFENAYIVFYLPDGWTCKQEGTEFVCSPPGKGPKSAIIIMTAKFSGPEDSLSQYVEHLNSLTKLPNVTMMQPPKQRKIQDSIWVDATLLNSEVQNYSTRYMAAIKGGLAILYTFSVHNKEYKQFADVSDFAVSNLQVKNVQNPKK